MMGYKPYGKGAVLHIPTSPHNHTNCGRLSICLGHKIEVSTEPVHTSMVRCSTLHSVLWMWLLCMYAFGLNIWF